MDDKQFNELVDILNRLIKAVDGVSTAIITRDPQQSRRKRTEKELDDIIEMVRRA